MQDKTKYILEKLGEAIYKRKALKKQAENALKAANYLQEKKCLK